MLVCPYAGTITGWEIFEDSNPQVTNGSIVIDIWKVATGAFPITLPAVANTIINTGAGGVKPTLTTAGSSKYTNLNNWYTTSVAANDLIKINVDSVTNCGVIVLVLLITQS